MAAIAPVPPSQTCTLVTVKALADSESLVSLPEQYLFRSREVDVDEAEAADIPVIDFSSLTAGAPLQRTAAVEQLGKACEEWGFFMVVNHGVPEREMEAVLDMTRRFFDLPEEVKRGYSGKHVLDPIRCGTSFNTSVEDVRYWRDYLKLVVHPTFGCPETPAGFRKVVADYASHMRHLTKELLKGISSSLGVEEEYIKHELCTDTGLQIFAANLYPPCPQPEAALGMPPHSDHGLVTVLMQNGVDGLQVRHQGKWVLVKPVPNSLVVNIGDHMEIFSNGKYKSVLHRAFLNNKTTRISIAVVQGPSLENTILPAARLVAKEPPRYKGMKYREFVEFQQSNKLNEKSVLDLIRNVADDM